MIIRKLWHSIQAQFNKIANYFWRSDPIAQMQLEYDKAVEEMRDGRIGLEQYRALVERVVRQVDGNKKQVANLEAKIKAYLKVGDRETAGKFAIELQKAKKELEENAAQLQMHETAYNNNLMKIQHATKKLGDLREKIQNYDADLKMSRAEAEMAQVAESLNFNVNVTTNFGEIEQVIQDQINANRAKVRVAADMSGQGMDEIKADAAVEKALAEDALKDFEAELGLVTPETAKVKDSAKELGPTKMKETAN